MERGREDTISTLTRYLHTHTNKKKVQIVLPRLALYGITYQVKQTKKELSSEQGVVDTKERERASKLITKPSKRSNPQEHDKKGDVKSRREEYKEEKEERNKVNLESKKKERGNLEKNRLLIPQNPRCPPLLPKDKKNTQLAQRNLHLTRNALPIVFA